MRDSIDKCIELCEMSSCQAIESNRIDRSKQHYTFYMQQTLRSYLLCSLANFQL